jgi:flagellin
MSLVLNTNVDSLIAQNSLASSGSTLSTALQQLSSGLRINTAADDAAGYAIVQGMTSQIGGLNQAAQNANDGVSLAQTANGSLQEITSDLQSMRDLAVESLNATNSGQDRADLNQQFSQLSADIDNVAKTANFNGVNLLDGSFAGQVFQTGANVGQTVTVSAIGSLRTSALGVYTGAALTDQAVGTAGASTIVVGGTGTGTGTFDLGAVAADASDVAAAINNANVQGLTATANANATAAGTGATAATAATNADVVTVNGIAIDLTNSGNYQTNLANAVTSINNVSAETGVTATNNGGGITLSNTTGANITVAFAETTEGGTTASTAADYGLGGIGATTTSTYNVNYVAPQGAAGDLTLTGALSAVVGGTVQAIGLTGAAVSTLSVSTTAASNTALTAIDQALQQVASTGATLGAYQDRFQAAITGLNTDATNLTSARSGIQDTDYASATSTLSQAQILQQASTAMVAQANTIPQNILTLLQKLP